MHVGCSKLTVLFGATFQHSCRPRTRRGDITKVRPMNGGSKKYADTHCADVLPNKVERIIQNGLERLPNTFGIAAARNNFINELKNSNNNPRRPSEPSAPPGANIYKS